MQISRMPLYPNVQSVQCTDPFPLVKEWEPPYVSIDTHHIPPPLVGRLLVEGQQLVQITKSCYTSQDMWISTFHHNEMTRVLLHLHLEFTKRPKVMMRNRNQSRKQLYRRYYVDYGGRCVPQDVLRLVYKTAGVDYDNVPVGRGLTLCDASWGILETWYHETREVEGEEAIAEA